MSKDFRIAESIETMKTTGATAVTTEDLLAILIGNKAKAKNLLQEEPILFDKSLTGLKGILKKDINELKYLGLTHNEAARVTAAIELGTRISRLENNEPLRIQSPADAAKYLMSRLRYETHEKFFIILLNTKNHIIQIKQIAEGSLTSAVVHPREAFAPAVISHAACILAAHNHPSGDPYPSAEDRHLTKALADAGEVLGIPLMDHVVIGDGTYYSFREHGDL